MFRRMARAARVASTPPVGPAEWGGFTPFFDWDPANASVSGGPSYVVTALPDSSGNGRDATLLGGGPTFSAADASFGGLPSIGFPADGAGRRLAIACPGGPFGLALVIYAGVDPTSNLYAVSTTTSDVALYDAGSGDGLFHAWASPDFSEATPSSDSATTPTVLLLTSSGESEPSAADATVRFYAKSFTPSTVVNKAPISSSTWTFGTYQGSPVDAYMLRGSMGRIIRWEVDPSAEANAILTALAAKYSITVAP